MARIFFSTVSGIPNPKKLPCFYEGFIDALLREGNDVMLMVTNEFMDDCWSRNQLASYVNGKTLNNKIAKFNPDLVITFNNSLYEEIPKIIDCPIAVWATDAPAIFAGKDKLKKNVARHHFICATQDMHASVKEYFNARQDRINTVYFATDFVAENIEQDKNISFVGTNFTQTGKLKEFLKNKNIQDDFERNDFIKFIKSYESDVLKTPAAHAKELGINFKLINAIPHSDFLNLISSNFRIQTLKNICDLGLHLYGTKNWYDVLDFSLKLALCFNEKEISSVKENQDLYNQSKISINITHAQAKRGFGWRVRDIMATNACLVSDYREELVTQFGEYVKIPTYRTPCEARELCQKLLKDDMWRREIVAGSQLAIAQGHRFKHRLHDLENIFEINLINNKKGRLAWLHVEDFTDKILFLEHQKELLRRRIQILEKGAQYKAINFFYAAGAKILPKSIKNIIKNYCFDDHSL